MCDPAALIGRRPDGLATTPLFWDCECEDEYIHPVSQERCWKCLAKREDQPDSRVEEVLRHAYDYNLPIDLVRALEAAVPDLADLTAIPF